MGDMLTSVVRIKALLITVANNEEVTDRVFDKDHRALRTKVLDQTTWK